MNGTPYERLDTSKYKRRCYLIFPWREVGKGWREIGAGSSGSESDDKIRHSHRKACEGIKDACTYLPILT
jgi:hypothetical protein